MHNCLYFDTLNCGILGLLEMVFPLTLLRTAQNHPMLIELKNGETYNGHLEACDCWMNVHLRDVICTSKEGDRFWRIPEAFIRGCSIKYLRIPEEVMDCVRDEIKETRKHQRENAKRKNLMKNMVNSEKNKVQNTSQHKY
ncbi:putative U6 snRNA-associated Sm-like protein LSm4 [Trichinella pseudospiralis]|uniref:U6 snRNA-associated Sm-like protein LSm4 n=3 Tax=Trichinella pseudospiralis TaxID=6337 RepID=A0A0V1JG72_TRIPS|nr:putative U6 snRNA-associated Sm-like protein LSm4 [Trichinella pseudospiralis]